MGINVKDISKVSKAQSKSNTTNYSGAKNRLKDFGSKDISFGSSKLSIKKKERFFSELAVLLSSGIDIKTALEIVESQQEKKSDKKIYNKIYESVIGGTTLSLAIESSGLFTTYDYFSIQIGEESGRVADVLADLSNYYSKVIKQKRQLTSAFTYPIMVLITALAAVIFMLNFMVPMFEDIFTRTESTLPDFTRFIINVSDFFSENLYKGFIAIAVIITTILIIRKKEFYRKFSTYILIRIPIIGPVVKMVYLEKFFQSMALLISSKVTMLRSIQLVRNMISFYPFEKALETIANDILHGKSLCESMAQFYLFDKRVTSLVKVGEEVNQLDKIFEKLNDQYSNELEHQISIMGTLLEPFLIIFVGGLVAVILIAMYLPMFKMATSLF